MTSRGLDDDGPARLLRRDDVQTVLASLAAPDEETRLVGGCVRDALLGRNSSDIDLATTLEPAQTLSLAIKAGLRAIPTGFDHGTVTVLVARTPFEVTTLREDIETDGRHAVVRFGRDFVRDAERRDFTINALSLDPSGQVHDTAGGVRDLGDGRVRFIGDAATRIQEDALRILRFFRFHARYGLAEPDAAGLSACIAAQHMIDGLSRERVRTELLKLLVAPGVAEALAVMDEVGILPRLIGGPTDLSRLGRLIGARPQAGDVARLAALAVRSKADVVRLQPALRLSKAEAAALSSYALAWESLDRRKPIDLGTMRTLTADHDPEALMTALASMDPSQSPPIAEDAGVFLEAVGAGRAQRPTFPLTGADLASNGITPGPAVGRGLDAARAYWLERDCSDDPSAIEALIEIAMNAARTK